MSWRAIALTLLAATGCGASEDPLTAPDTSACGDDTPVVTWETFGEGFVTTYCQGCHAESAVDRHGAPEDIVFDSEEDVLWVADLVLDVATGDVPSMPPNGGPQEEQRERLTVWLSCYAE